MTQVVPSKLMQYEQTIERGIKTFAEVGNALMAIRDEKLYRADYDTFEDYCLERWGFSRVRAHHMIDAAKVMDVLTMVNEPPGNERQARELVPLLSEPDTMREVMREVTSSGRVTASTIKEAVRSKIGGMAAESKREITQATSHFTPEMHSKYSAQTMEACGWLMSHAEAIATKYEPVSFAKSYGKHLHEKEVASARMAHKWLTVFLNEMGDN